MRERPAPTAVQGFFARQQATLRAHQARLRAQVALTLDRKEAERQGKQDTLALRRLRHFARQAWPIIEPTTPLEWNWHLDILCDALQRQIEGEVAYRRLVVMMPPGTAKSIFVSVMAAAWEWLHHPGQRKLFLSNDDKLAVRDSRRTRLIITSEWYQRLADRAARERGERPWRLAGDQNEKVNFENGRRGFRQCFGIRSDITGKRGDGIVIDDPIDAKQVLGKDAGAITERVNKANEVIDTVLPSRVNDQETATWTLIMQRLHPDDPAGQALKENAAAVAEGQAPPWTVLCFQMEYDPEAPHNHPDDPRAQLPPEEQHGALLFPRKFSRAVLDWLRRKLGGQQYEAQYNQAPVLASGGIFRAPFWLYTDEDPRVLAHRCDAVALSLDCTFKNTATADRVSIQVWGRIGRLYYLLADYTKRRSFRETVRDLVHIARLWPMAHLKLIEDAANGPAVIDTLHGALDGLIPFSPTQWGSKPTRAQRAAIAAEAHQVYLPNPERNPWVAEWKAEVEGFGVGARFDDRVDAFSQIIIRWMEEDRGDRDLEAAMREFAGLL